MCWGGGGGGVGWGIAHPFILSTDRQKRKIMWPCGPVPTHAGARKPRHVGVGRCFDLGGGGVAPLPPASYAYARECQEFFSLI